MPVAGGSEEHDLIAGNVLPAGSGPISGAVIFVLSGNMKIHIPVLDIFYHPDSLSHL
jgi:hypothetical protein